MKKKKKLRIIPMYARYKNWERSLDDPVDNDILLDNVWTMLQEPDKATDDQFFSLLRNVIMSVNKKSLKILIDQSKEKGLFFGNLLLSLASSVLAALCRNLPALRVNTSGKTGAEFYAYLFMTIKYTAMHCITPIIDEMKYPSGVKEGEKADGAYENTQYITTINQPDTMDKIRIKGDLESTLALDLDARRLYDLITQFWEGKHKNVLCHWYESQYGASARLASESKDNIYKLHERVRKKLLQTCKDHGLGVNVARVFFRKYMPKLCQAVPASATYKYVKDLPGRTNER